MITNEIFATQDQILGYLNHNLQSIVARDNLASLDSLEVSNYYIFEEDGKESSIMLVNSKTDFYVSLTKVLIKKTDQDVFSKIPSPTKQNLNNGMLEHKISNGILRIKYIDRNDRIKIVMRPVAAIAEQIRPIRRGRDQINNYFGTVALATPTPTPTPTVAAAAAGGHMMDYIRLGQMELIPARPSLITSSSIQPSTVEEIVDEADYKVNVTCKICLSNKINIVCIPCGHCFCSECNTQSRNNLCALCRKPITKTQPLFI